MDLRLHLLETFMATGADGASYKVYAYERLAPDASLADGEHWEPTGVIEYRLADNRPVEAGRDGSMRIVASGLTLTPVEARRAQTSSATT
jgi:hypothetical protein